MNKKGRHEEKRKDNKRKYKIDFKSKGMKAKKRIRQRNIQKKNK